MSGTPHKPAFLSDVGVSRYSLYIYICVYTCLSVRCKGVYVQLVNLFNRCMGNYAHFTVMLLHLVPNINPYQAPGGQRLISYNQLPVTL